MRFNWLHYLDLASELSDQAKISEPKEAKLRSSISRAYYAIFHKSRQHLEDNWGITIDKDSSAHQQVSDEFANRQITDEFKQSIQQRISENLTRMRKNRNKADYREKCGNLERTAQDTINRAMQVISDLDSV
jgi:uncharacterized protein (UPF0332 family)